jgi:hypothetical protein
MDVGSPAVRAGGSMPLHRMNLHDVEVAAPSQRAASTEQK